MTKRPSPAMIVAMAALCFALVGTAVAQDPVGKITKSKVKQISKKQANKVIDQKAPNLAVKSATTATTATNATNAVKATDATNAVNAVNAVSSNSADTLFARARIEDSPFGVGLAKNITAAQVTNPVVGTYCFDLAFVPVNVQVTNEVDSDNDEVLSALIEPGGQGLAGCPVGTDVEVTSWDTGSAAAEDSDFYIELSR